ncbi:MAG: phage terminase large subunit, partial [Pyrinomonadaceae bacterium]
TAVSIKTTADYTASFRCALDAQGNLYIAGGFRMRIEYPDQRRFIIERMQAEPDTEHGIEETLHGKAIIQDLRRERHLTRCVFRGVRVTADKVTRASAWAARAEEGKVILVRGAWIREFLDEVCSFPNARHDDQVDAVSIAVQMIEKPKFRYAGF